MRETKEALENASVGLEVLKEGTGKLNFNLSLVRSSIQRTLNDPGCHDEESDATSAQLCRNIRQSLSQLQISANFTRVRAVNATPALVGGKSGFYLFTLMRVAVKQLQQVWSVLKWHM